MSRRGGLRNDMHMRGVGRMSPVDQSLVTLVSDPSPTARIRCQQPPGLDYAARL